MRGAAFHVAIAGVGAAIVCAAGMSCGTAHADWPAANEEIVIKSSDGRCLTLPGSRSNILRFLPCNQKLEQRWIAKDGTGFSTIAPITSKTACLAVSANDAELAALMKCKPSSPKWVFEPSGGGGRIRSDTENLCLSRVTDPNVPNEQARIAKCEPNGGHQLWTVDKAS
ncbi:ricin-type beta-trefoil lectin domain protein [Nocardia xishanensis]|uniref:ricin-type beta-trefoil lectin domain protein n=1 Tax=Nocardia xishanensis TaxID=238964 RepID=UPI0012F5252C|nr:ricin-type beta-trefoil lectin domain protein [Nocardia xishanensis]